MGNNDSTELAKAIASQKSYVGPAVIVFILYWGLWLPGLIFNILWLKEARKTQEITGVQPGGVGCLRVMLVIGFLPFVLFVFLGLIRLGVFATRPSPSTLAVPPEAETTAPMPKPEELFGELVKANEKQAKILIEAVLPTPRPVPTPSPQELRQQAFDSIKAIGLLRQSISRANRLQGAADHLRSQADRYLEIKFNNFPVTHPITNQTTSFSWERDGAAAVQQINAIAQQVENQARSLREQTNTRFAQYGTTIDTMEQKLDELWNTIDSSGISRTLYESVFATVTKKSFKEKNIAGDNPDDDIVLTVETTNNTNRTIDTIEGEWEFLDSSGNEIYKNGGVIQGPISPRATLQSLVLVDYNSWDKYDKRFKSISLDYLKITFHPRAISFTHGEMIRASIDRDWK